MEIWDLTDEQMETLNNTKIISDDYFTEDELMLFKCEYLDAKATDLLNLYNTKIECLYMYIGEIEIEIYSGDIDYMLKIPKSIIPKIVKKINEILEAHLGFSMSYVLK